LKVLLTGSFGNVGMNTLSELLQKGHEVRCFDIETSKNLKMHKKAGDLGDFEIIWGDITDYEDVRKAVEGRDAIVHLAGIIPPLSEEIPEVAKKVNVDGTKNLIQAAKQSPTPPLFVVASSISVYGSTMSQPPPRKVSDELSPLDNYSSHKVQVEKMIKESGLSYHILRLAAVSLPKIPNKMDPILFEVPLDQRIEFVDSRDVGKAFANALDLEEKNLTFNIGGGKGCQIYQRDYVESMFNAMGLSMLPDSAFRMPQTEDEWFYTDWLDTENSQKLLNYQTISFEDYIEELRDDITWRRFGAKIVSPFVKLSLLISSPYYKFTKKDEEEFAEFDHKKIQQLTEANSQKIEALESKVQELGVIIKQLQS